MSELTELFRSSSLTDLLPEAEDRTPKRPLLDVSVDKPLKVQRLAKVGVVPDPK